MRVPDVDLEFVLDESDAVLFALRSSGELLVGDRSLGRLEPDGAFVFTGVNQGASAVLAGDGRVRVSADPSALGPMDSEVGELLRSSDGTVHSGYRIAPDATASIARGPTLELDADGRIPGRGLAVRNLSASTRLTAMFVYVLLTTITP